MVRALQLARRMEDWQKDLAGMQALQYASL